MTAAFDPSRYFAPGVYTQSVTGPQVGIQSSAPSSVAIFGAGRGYQIDSQTVIIPADFTDPNTLIVSAVNSKALRQSGINLATVIITDVAHGNTYAVQTVPSPANGDYTLTATVGPSGIVNGFDSTYQIIRVLGGTLAAATSVQVSYQYVNSGYYSPQKLYSFDDVVSLYGKPFDSTGTIISELSMACQFAFINGAQSVITVPVQSSNPQISDYVNALAKFEGFPGISVIVCANGNAAIFPFISSHVDIQSSLRNERRAIVGTDGSASTISSSTRISVASGIADSRVALISPSSVPYYNISTSQIQYIGAQYLAAAVAGISVSQNPAQPLTRRSIIGFAGIDFAPDQQKSIETQAGLMVIDSANNNNAIRIRHGVTTDPSTLLNREWSILSQQDSMAFRIRSFFNSGGVIGSIITSLTLTNIKSSAESALQSLTADGTIQAYQNLAVRQSSTNLDVVEIAYSWQPSLPLNYIVVRFTLNVTSGDTGSNSTNV